MILFKQLDSFKVDFEKKISRQQNYEYLLAYKELTYSSESSMC